MSKRNVLTGIVIEESTVLTLDELCRACGRPTEWILELVEEGIIEPEREDQNHWQFHGHCLRRVRIAHRLQSDLGVNPAGAALVLELLEEVETLRHQLAALER